MNVIKVGKLIVNESEFPILTTEVYDGDKMVDRGYLSPFRGYKFQISRTVEGERDLASTEVIGLANIILATESFTGKDSNLSIYLSNVQFDNGNAAKSIFMAYAMEAIGKWAYRHDAMPMFNHDNLVLMDEFIDKTYTYVKGLIK